MEAGTFYLEVMVDLAAEPGIYTSQVINSRLFYRIALGEAIVWKNL